MTKRITIDAITQAAMAIHRVPQILETVEQSAELHERVKVFEAVVWFPRLQGQVNGTSARGMSALCRGIKVMTWCCAGRCLIQLERAGQRLTLITADDETPWSRECAHVAPPMGPMGIQSIDAEFLEAMKMLYEVTRYGEEIILHDDEEVTIS